MKKLINSPDAVLRESLEGVELAYGDRVRVAYDPPFVVRADAPVEGKVGGVWGWGLMRRSKGRWGSCPEAAPGTSPCTAGSSGPGCWTRLAQARSSPRLRP